MKVGGINCEVGLQGGCQLPDHSQTVRDVIVLLMETIDSGRSYITIMTMWPGRPSEFLVSCYPSPCQPPAPSLRTCCRLLLRTAGSGRGEPAH